MIETNIKLVQFGKKLYLDVRYAKVVTQDSAPELLEKACNALLQRYNLPAVKDSVKQSQIIVLSNNPIPKVTLEDDNWHLEIEDTGHCHRLHFSNPEEQFLMTQLLERSLLKQVARSSNFSMLDSYRIFYEKESFTEKNSDVLAFRRYEIASIPIEEMGVGLVVDIGTAFFTNLTVADFFREDISEEQKAKLRRRFNKLSQRQEGNKGTLIYEYKPGKYSKCYFDSFCPGITASTTGKIRIGGETYNSLQDYYKIKNGIKVDPDEPVAKVSFKGIPYPVYVAASKLRLRVMNDALPKSLKNIDKISPSERFRLINKFWTQLGDYPLGKDKPKVEKGFWRPSSEVLFYAQAPDLLFGNNNILKAPLNGHIGEHKEFYSKRISYLDKYGCFYVPPSVPRTLYVAIPQEFGEVLAQELADSVAELLSRWLRIDIEVDWLLYQTQKEAIDRLQNETSSGVVLFVFEDDDPATYFNLAYELQGWRIKRITKSKFRELAAEFRFANDANQSGKVRISQYPRSWYSFIKLNVLDIIEQMDCVPWTLSEEPYYKARLAIDVGENHRFFALSLLIFQSNNTKPFRLETKVENKTDSKKETINRIILQDKIVELGERAIKAGFANIDSFLSVRDGRQCGDENKAIEYACQQFIDKKFLSKNGKTDSVDFHKNSVKGIRIWNRKKDGSIGHAIEGVGIKLNSRMVVIANTGAATLRQGTAEPVVLETRDENVDLVNIAKDLHKTCHLNWSNPIVAQRLSIELKRTDEGIKNKASQEIRRLK